MRQDGILLIDKEEGLSSRSVDNRVGRLLGTRKAGHLGTLDPFATGLLLVAVGKGTKALPYIEDEEKRYEARLLLGQKTDTGDKEGTLIEEKAVPSLTKEEIEKVFSSFLGKGTQIPPMHSAIKKDGIPLYKLAHKGESIEREPRPIEIKELLLKSFDEKEIVFEALVSKGTYIRVLGEDISSRLGTLGHLLSLRRLSIGKIDLSKAKPLDKIGQEDLMDPADFIALPRHSLDQRGLALAQNGVRLSFPNESAERLLLTYEGEAIAVYRKEGARYLSERGLF